MAVFNCTPAVKKIYGVQVTENRKQFRQEFQDEIAVIRDSFLFGLAEWLDPGRLARWIYPSGAAFLGGVAGHSPTILS